MSRLARLGGLLLAVFLASAAGTAFAQDALELLPESERGTPDGLPPSAETVCDGLEGVQFGLCNAYCEAMDCDSPSPNANAQACSRVREKFLDAGGDFSRLNCGCPCDFSASALDTFFEPDGLVYCINISPDTGGFGHGWALVGHSPEGGSSAAIVEFEETFNTAYELQHPSCGLQSPFVPFTMDGHVGNLTDDQAIACRNQLLEYNACDCGDIACDLR